MLLTSRTRVVSCRCDSKPSAAKSFVKQVFDKRSKAVKENLSRLSVIGTAEYKDFVEVIEELDKFHRKVVEELSNRSKKDDTVVVSPEQKKTESIFDDQ